MNDKLPRRRKTEPKWSLREAARVFQNHYIYIVLLNVESMLALLSHVFLINE
jgi:hypothetical protein